MEFLIEELALAGSNAKLVLMPVSRVLVEKELSVGRFRIFPPGSVDVAALHPISGHTLSDEMKTPGPILLTGQPLREVASSLTGFSIETMASSALVAFIADVNWDALSDANHEDDVATLRLLSATAERAFDLIRLKRCRLDLPDTLPGIVGSWEGSGPYIGAMLYCLERQQSRLIAGAAAGYTTVVRGIGLELDFDFLPPLPSAADGEVGAFAIHALSLFSDAMHASNDTSKFMRTMTLLEFLASPDDYQNWKKLKGSIACHCTKTKQSYLNLIERFKELTSKKDLDGTQRGYRTLVVHHGQFLEEVVPDRKNRRELFLELQGYCSSVIEDMLKHAHLTWVSYSDRRLALKAALGIVCPD